MKPILLALFALIAVAAIVTVLLHSSQRASVEGIADSETGKPPVFVFIQIPEPIMPSDRSDKYEDPLNTSLQQAGLGEVTGGGSQLGEADKDGERRIQWVGIDVDLNDLAKGLPFLKSELKRLGAPAGTIIEYEINGEKTSETL